jgi:hypothetical protein
MLLFDLKILLIITISMESVLEFEDSIWFAVLSLFGITNATHFIACKLVKLVFSGAADMYICI